MPEIDPDHTRHDEQDEASRESRKQQPENLEAQQSRRDKISIEEQLRQLQERFIHQQDLEQKWERRYKEQERIIQDLKARNEGTHQDFDRNQQEVIAKQLTTLQEQFLLLKKPSKEKAAWTEYLNNPLIEEIQQEQVPSSFKQCKEKYDGTKDPSEHLIQYNDFMEMVGASDKLKCKVFPSTLRENARTWFLSLPTDSVCDFEQLGCLFLARFKAFKKIPKEPSYLYQIKQKPYESLKDFLQRFNLATMEVKDLQDSWAIDAFIQGVKHRDLRYAISDRKPKTLSELLGRARTYANVDDLEEQRNEENLQQDVKPHSYASNRWDTQQTNARKRASDDDRGNYNKKNFRGEIRNMNQDDGDSDELDMEHVNLHR